MSRYAYVGGTSGQLLSYGGKVLVHGNKAEMEYLIPNTRVVRITEGDLGQPVMRLQDHPGLDQVRFPLDRKDFPSG